MSLFKTVAGVVVLFAIVGGQKYNNFLFPDSGSSDDPRNAYDGAPYSGSDFDLNAQENAYYMHCRNELVRLGQYFLNSGAETGCACIADKVGKYEINPDWESNRAMFTYRMEASINDKAGNGFRIPVVKFAKDFSMPNSRAATIYEQLRSATNYCTPPNAGPASAKAGSKPSAAGNRSVIINRGGKSQTATIVDGEGNKKTVTVPGSKGMIIIGTADGMIVKPR